MATILFGGPDECGNAEKNCHNELILGLQKNHKLIYSEDASFFLSALYFSEVDNILKLGHEKFDLVLYDARLFYPAAQIEGRAERFSNFAIPALKFPEKPFIVLVDFELEEFLKSQPQNFEFNSISIPYDAKEVLLRVDSLLLQ